MSQLRVTSPLLNGTVQKEQTVEEKRLRVFPLKALMAVTRESRRIEETMRNAGEFSTGILQELRSAERRWTTSSGSADGATWNDTAAW